MPSTGFALRGVLVEELEVSLVNGDEEAGVVLEGGLDVGVAELLADPVDVGSGCEGERGTGVSHLVKGAVFDTGGVECFLPDSASPVVEVDVAAVGGGEDEGVVVDGGRFLRASMACCWSRMVRKAVSVLPWLVRSWPSTTTLLIRQVPLARSMSAQVRAIHSSGRSPVAQAKMINAA
jgi:hypothetical protein